MLHLAVDIFSRNPGLAFLARWAHVVVGIVWIGILYYFNFVQTPALAEMEPAARNNAIAGALVVPLGCPVNLPDRPSDSAGRGVPDFG